MTIWSMYAQEGTLVGYVPDETLSKALVLCGIDPVAVRGGLHAAGANIVQMQLAKPSAAAVEVLRQSMPDLIIWSWIAILSRRAMATAVELGCGPEEFWPCQFQSNPEEELYFHLPVKVFDIVDVDRSTFKDILPLDPPLPMFIESLVTKPLPNHLPPCFRSKRPGTAKVFSEFFVRDDFRLAWIKSGFSGADFRQLST